ncbi:MAG: DNA primase [Mycoplasmataceae bacterium]|nr:DNA primase [Mycoplasmataceae bacterium]
MPNQVNFGIIKEIQEKADIVAVISSLIKLTRKGNNYIGLCPFHADKNPSLVVSPQKKIFKCFVCGAKGNVFGFIQQYQKVSYLEAVKIVAKMIGYDESHLNFQTHNTYLNPATKRLIDLNVQVNDWFQGLLHNPENQDQLAYLHQRGLNDEVIKTFEFGYAPHAKDLIYRMASNDQNMFGTSRNKELIWNEKELLDAGLIVINQEGKVFDFFNARITIPIYDNNGYLVAFSGRSTTKAESKYLNTPTTTLFSKANVLFNFHRVKNQNIEKIIIVEGFMDAIAYSRAGYANVVATMGVALTNEHINALHTLTKLTTVILSFDNDDAGAMATIANGQKLMENGFNTYVVGSYSKNIKDADELMNTVGKDAIDEILNERVDYISFLINNEFQSKKPIDEIQKSTNTIIAHLIDFADNSLLLRQQHLKLLADKSGLAFEDLKSKYDYDYAKTSGVKGKQRYQFNANNPNNEVGLNPKFIEPSEAELKEVEQAEANDNIVQLENQYQAVQTKLNNGFNHLILSVLHYPEGFKKVDEAININLADFPLEQHKFIFKSIQYILNKEMALNELSLTKFLKEHGTGDSITAKHYRSAYEFFIDQVNDPIYQSYFREHLSKNREQRIDELINRIQLINYEFMIYKLVLKIWKLKKQNNPADLIKIDKLNKELIDTRQMLNQWVHIHQRKKKK